MNIEELNAFLTNVHNTLILNRKLSTAHFTVVMGNEAADLDSMVCAVLYAYLLQKQQQLHPVDSQIDQHYYIPIINIPQDDFPIHTESVYVFNRVGLDTSKLVFWDTARLQALIEKDVDSPRSPRIELQSVILVDHNIPTGSQQFLSPFIKEVVDHHADETNKLPALEKKTLEGVGSASTLVAEKILQFVKENSIELDSRIKLMLLATILTDTANFNPKAQKTTPKDVAIAQELSPEVDDLSAIQTTLYEEVLEAKSDIKNLTTIQLLKKDYKEWDIEEAHVVHKCGMASALLSSASWLARDSNLLSNLWTFCRDGGLQVLIVLTSYLDEEKNNHKELILYVPPFGVADQDGGSEWVYSKLETFLNSFDLNPTPLPLDFEGVKKGSLREKFSFYKINPIYARKRLSPKLAEFLKTL